MPAAVWRAAAYVFGGASGEEERAEVLKIDAGGRATEVARMPQAMRAHQAIVVGDAVYLLGGFVGGTTLADVFRMDLSTWKVERLAPMPRESAWFTATSLDRKIYVVGGFAGAEYWEDIAVYDVDTNRWESHKGAFAHPLFPNQRIGSNTAVGYKGRIHSFGGADTFDPARMRANALSASATYAPEAQKWDGLPSQAVAREGLVAARDGDFAYLVGGMTAVPEEASRLVERVDLRTGKVEPFAQLVIGRVAPGVAVLDGKLLVIGGVVDPPFGMAVDIESVELV
jgi:hypothetical protein